eukprot:g2260.t1
MLGVRELQSLTIWLLRVTTDAQVVDRKLSDEFTLSLAQSIIRTESGKMEVDDYIDWFEAFARRMFNNEVKREMTASKQSKALEEEVEEEVTVREERTPEIHGTKAHVDDIIQKVGVALRDAVVMKVHLEKRLRLRETHAVEKENESVLASWRPANVDKRQSSIIRFLVQWMKNVNEAMAYFKKSLNDKRSGTVTLNSPALLSRRRKSNWQLIHLETFARSLAPVSKVRRRAMSNQASAISEDVLVRLMCELARDRWSRDRFLSILHAYDRRHEGKLTFAELGRALHHFARLDLSETKNIVSAFGSSRADCGLDVIAICQTLACAYGALFVVEPRERGTLGSPQVQRRKIESRKHLTERLSTLEFYFERVRPLIENFASQTVGGARIFAPNISCSHRWSAKIDTRVLSLVGAVRDIIGSVKSDADGSIATLSLQDMLYRNFDSLERLFADLMTSIARASSQNNKLLEKDVFLWHCRIGGVSHFLTGDIFRRYDPLSTGRVVAQEYLIGFEIDLRMCALFDVLTMQTAAGVKCGLFVTPERRDTDSGEEATTSPPGISIVTPRDDFMCSQTNEISARTGANDLGEAKPGPAWDNIVLPDADTITDRYRPMVQETEAHILCQILGQAYDEVKREPADDDDEDESTCAESHRVDNAGDAKVVGSTATGTSATRSEFSRASPQKKSEGRFVLISDGNASIDESTIHAKRLPEKGRDLYSDSNGEETSKRSFLNIAASMAVSAAMSKPSRDDKAAFVIGSSPPSLPSSPEETDRREISRSTSPSSIPPPPPPPPPQSTTTVMMTTKRSPFTYEQWKLSRAGSVASRLEEAFRFVFSAAKKIDGSDRVSFSEIKRVCKDPIYRVRTLDIFDTLERHRLAFDDGLFGMLSENGVRTSVSMREAIDGIIFVARLHDIFCAASIEEAAITTDDKLISDASMVAELLRNDVLCCRRIRARNAEPIFDVLDRLVHVKGCRALIDFASFLGCIRVPFTSNKEWEDYEANLEDAFPGSSFSSGESDHDEENAANEGDDAESALSPFWQRVNRAFAMVPRNESGLASMDKLLDALVSDNIALRRIGGVLWDGPVGVSRFAEDVFRRWSRSVDDEGCRISPSTMCGVLIVEQELRLLWAETPATEPGARCSYAHKGAGTWHAGRKRGKDLLRSLHGRSVHGKKLFHYIFALTQRDPDALISLTDYFSANEFARRLNRPAHNSSLVVRAGDCGN